MKLIIKILVFIPNLPLLIITILYVIYKTYEENGVVETEMMEEKDELDWFLFEKIIKLYPKNLSRLIAAIFYVNLIIHYSYI